MAGKFKINTSGMKKLEGDLEKKSSGGLQVLSRGAEEEAVRSLQDQLKKMGVTPNDSEVRKMVRDARKGYERVSLSNEGTSDKRLDPGRKAPGSRSPAAGRNRWRQRCRSGGTARCTGSVGNSRYAADRPPSVPALRTSFGRCTRRTAR